VVEAAQTLTAPAPAADAPAADPQGGFAVNLGTFSQASNAESLRSRLRGAGFPMLVETIALDGKPATRLRAGPYATRAEAERARVLVGQTVQGVSASVVALDPTPARDAPPGAIANRAAGWAVQVGAFSTEADALTLRDRLRSGGQPAFVERVPTDKGALFRVRVGPELRREAANALKATLKQRFALDGIVVAHP
jgi:cell division septation protein DedD